MNIINEDNYVKRAEEVILKLRDKTDRKGKKISMLTTNQIRNLLAMNADILNDINRENSKALSDAIISKINYMKIRFVYEAGREEKVKDFLAESKLIYIIDEIGKDASNYKLFSRYFEALVAYHRYYGGKDH